MYRTYLQILYGRTVGWVLTTGSTSPGSGGSRASPPPSPSPLAPLGTCSPCWFSYKSNAFYSLIFIIFLDILLTFVQVGSTLRHLFFFNSLLSVPRSYTLCMYNIWQDAILKTFTMTLQHPCIEHCDY